MDRRAHPDPKHRQASGGPLKGRQASGDTLKTVGLGAFIVLLLGVGWLLLGRSADPEGGPAGAAEQGQDTPADQGQDEPASLPGCETTTTVEVTTTEDFAPVVRAAAERAAGAAGACADYRVATAPSAQVAQQLAQGEPGPHVWIPDSTMWVDRVNAEREDDLVPGVLLAESPVVLAAPEEQVQTDEPQPWASLLSGELPLRISDPAQSTASLVSLMAASQALSGTVEERRALGSATIALSRQVTPQEQLFAQAAENPDVASAFPASEQQIHRHNAEHADASLAAVVPADGMARLAYPWVPVATGDQAPTAQMSALLAALTDGYAGETVTSEGFRAPWSDEGPGVPAMPSELPEPLPPPPAEAVAEALGTFQAVATDMRMLAVVDVSGSMLQPVGDRTRVELASESAQAGLQLFPPTSQVGLWQFSTELVGEQDWQPRVPIAPIEATRGDGTQREALVEAAASLPSQVGGDTGLFDTVLGAYLEVQDQHDPAYVNSVVILTDGVNDDPGGGLSLEELLAELEEAADPERPVRVITVGMGPDVNADVLTTIAESTGGTSYIAEDPADIRTVFVDALLQRS